MAEESSRVGKYALVLVTGAVSLAVGVGSGLLLDLFRGQAARLTYTITSAEVFPGESQKTGIVLVRVANVGRREAEDVLCRISLIGASIREQRVSGLSNIDQATKTTSDTIEVRLPFLNPREQLSFHLLLDMTGSQLVPPSVELRAKGVTGTQEGLGDAERSVFSRVVSLGGGIFAGLATSLAFLLQFRERLGAGRLGSSHQGDQRDVLAYVLGAHGFFNEAEEMRRLSRSKIYYWSACDELVERWLRNGDRGEIARGVGTLLHLLDYARIAGSSSDLIRLNVARLAAGGGDGQAARDYLAEIREPNSRVIKSRVAHDQGLAALSRDQNSGS